MAASMDSRAASLMNAARRRLFVSRIEKYEAKVRHAKALMKQQKEAALPLEERRSVSSSEEQQFAIEEGHEKAVPEQRHPVLDSEDQQPRSVLDKLMLPLPSEKNLVLGQVAFEPNIPAEHHQELPPKEKDRECPHTDKHCYSQKDCLGGKGLVSQDEEFQQHYGVESPQQRMCLQQKEMISGRSALPHMKTIVKDFDALDIVPPSAEKLPMEAMIPLDQQVNIYSDLKLPLTSDVNMQVLATALKVRIKAADMSASMQEHAFRSARQCLDTVGKLQSKRIAYTLKKEFDKVYGPAWHCIVGTSFGSYVTHSLGGFVYFSLEKVSVLLFKTTVEPIINP